VFKGKKSNGCFEDDGNRGLAASDIRSWKVYMNNSLDLANDEAIFNYGIYVMTIYAVAATNLYGLISLEELAKLTNAYRVGAPPIRYAMYTQNLDFIRMPRNIRPDDVMKYLEMNAKTQGYVALIENRGTLYLASRDFLITSEDGTASVDWEDVEAILRAREGKPRYRPQLSEFVSYGGIGKYDPYAQCGALFTWLSKREVDKKNSQQKLADKIKVVISDDDFDIEEVIRVVDNVLIHKNMDRLTLTIDERNELFALLCDIKNNTRSWKNYGHTPNEMVALPRGQR
jgi:hypothetical protein